MAKRAKSQSSPPLHRPYVANEYTDSISVIDPTNLSLIARVPTGIRPQNVNVDPLGRYFYATVLFTKESDDLVEIYDVGTNTLLTSVVVGHQPSHVIPNAAGNRLYVSSEFGNGISIISIPEFRRIGTLKLKGRGPRGHAITPDGQVLLIPNSRSGDVSVVDLVHQKV